MLRKFNSFKGNSNHADLLSKIRIYKKHEAKAKHIYKNTEGDQLSLLKQNNPNQFFAKFKKSLKLIQKFLWKIFMITLN